MPARHSAYRYTDAMRPLLPKLLMAACVLALAASLVANWILYSTSQAYYRELNQVRLDPLSLAAFEPRRPTEISDDARVVVLFGDSRVAQWVPEPKASGLYVINRGIGAQTSAQVLARFDAHVRALKPEIVVVQACVNDLKTVPLFFDQKDLIVARCKDNLGEIVARSNQLNARVVLVTIFPFGHLPFERRLVWSDDVEAARRAINDWMKSQAKDGVEVLDADLVLADVDGNAITDYQVDFLHVNARAYRALNAALEPLLAPVPSQTP